MRLKISKEESVSVVVTIGHILTEAMVISHVENWKLRTVTTSSMMVMTISFITFLEDIYNWKTNDI